MSDKDSIQVLADLNTRESQIEELIRRQWWVSVPLTTFPASMLLGGEQRLDAGSYASESFRALVALRKSGLRFIPLSEMVTNIDYPGRFKRIYATSKKAGTPFLTASKALHFRPSSDYFLAKSSPSYESCFVDEGVLLLTRSGTVGRPIIVTSHLSQFALSDDLIRIYPGEAPVGYIYAYLSTWLGQALISKDQYGSAIKHLEPHHIKNIPTPLADQETQLAIHARIMAAFQLREDANALLDEGDSLLYELLGLPKFDIGLVDHYQSEGEGDSLIPAVKSFVLNVKGLNERLDASYHVPGARTAVKLVKKSPYKAVQLGDMVDQVYIPPRFKRIYVPEEFGIPLLQGSHIPQFAPADLKFISKSETKGLDRWLIRKGWVLVTCSGTIGRIGLVTHAQDGWAASQHLLRILPREGFSHPGYIAAFLTTPYGQHQLTSKIYGAVVDELTEADTEAVWIPNAPYDIQEQIGDKVMEAYEKKEQANQLEEKAIRQLEMIIGGKAVEITNEPETPEQDTEQIEWGFEPTLGYEIEPELTQLEFEDFLTRLSVPREDESDLEKKGT